MSPIAAKGVHGVIRSRKSWANRCLVCRDKLASDLDVNRRLHVGLITERTPTTDAWPIRFPMVMLQLDVKPKAYYCCRTMVDEDKDNQLPGYQTAGRQRHSLAAM